MSQRNNNSQNNVYFSDYLRKGQKKRTIKDVLLFLLPVIGIGIAILIITLLALKFKERKKSIHNPIGNEVVSVNNDNNLNNDFSNVVIITTESPKSEITTRPIVSDVHIQAITTEQIVTDPTTIQENGIKIGFVITEHDPLNVREDSNISSKVIGTIPKGGEISVISENGDWYEIDYFGKIGYVSKKLVSFDRNMVSQDNSKTSMTGKINTEKDPLNVRKQPSTDAKIIGTIPKGNKISIIDEADEWYVIEFGDDIGYVSKKYIVIIN